MNDHLLLLATGESLTIVRSVQVFSDQPFVRFWSNVNSSGMNPPPPPSQQTAKGDY